LQMAIQTLSYFMKEYILRRKKLTSNEKVKILIQPFISKKDIADILLCTAKISETIYNNILLLMKRNNYRILDYNHIPTKLFLTYCNLDIADFIEAASIETKINGNDNVA